MAGLISNLIIVLVFTISLGKVVQKPAEDSFSSPETIHLEVVGLNEEQITQIAETLGFFAKTILESTEKRKKKNAMKRSRFSQKNARFALKRAKNGQIIAKDGLKSARVGLQRPKDAVC